MPKLKTVAPEFVEPSNVTPEVIGEPIGLDVGDGAIRGPRLVGPDEIGVAGSPALSLQQLLIDGWEEAGPDDAQRWGPGLTILVSGVSAIVLWGLIIWAATSLFHLHLP